MSGPIFLKVSINRGHATGKSLLLNEGGLSFGSGPGNDFHLKLESIAERAFEIVKTLRGYEVLPQPAVEVLINGQPVSESQVLHDGDEIAIGPFEFKASFVPPIRDSDGKILTPVQIPIDVSVPKEDEAIAADRFLPKEEILARFRRPIGTFLNARFFFWFTVASVAFLFYQKFRSPKVILVEPEKPLVVASPIVSRTTETANVSPGSPRITPFSASVTSAQVLAAATPTQAQTPTRAPSPLPRFACIDIETEIGKTRPESAMRPFAIEYQQKWLNQIREKLDSLIAGPSGDSAVTSAVEALPGDWTRACQKPNERSQECLSRVKEAVTQKFWEVISKSQELPTLLRNPYRSVFESVRFEMRTEFLNLPGVEEANRIIFPRLQKELMKWLLVMPREAFKRDSFYDRVSHMGFEVAICTGSELSSSYLERENRVRWCYRPESQSAGRMIREFEIAELMARSIDYCRGMRILQSRHADRIKQANQHPLFSVIRCLNSKRESLGFGFDLALARALDGCGPHESLNPAVSSWVATELLVARFGADKTLQALSLQSKLEALHALVVRASSPSSGEARAAYLEATLLAHPQMRKALACGGLSKRNYCHF